MPVYITEPFSAAALSERAYQLLKKQIICANLAPGEKLKIHELAEKMQISRTPIKEAINRLADQGLITICSRKGTFVTVLDAAKIRELFEVRLMIELWGAERAFRQPTMSNLSKLEDTMRECEPLFSAAEPFDYEEFNRADTNFHMCFVKAAQNAKLLALYESLSVHIQAMRVYWGRARRPALKSHKEHTVIVESFREGSLEKLKSSLTAHIINAREDLIRAL